MTLMCVYIYHAYKERGFPWYEYQLASYLKVWEYVGHVWLTLYLSKYIYIHTYIYIYHNYNINIYTCVCVCKSSILQNLQAAQPPSLRPDSDDSHAHWIRKCLRRQWSPRWSPPRLFVAGLICSDMAKWPPKRLGFYQKICFLRDLAGGFIHLCCYVPFDYVKDFSGRYFSQPRTMGQSCGLISEYVLARCSIYPPPN